MSRQEWNDIAHALAKQREQVRRAQPVITSCSSGAQHLVWAQRLAGFDDAARAISSALDQRNTRFDERRFLLTVGVDSY